TEIYTHVLPSQVRDYADHDADKTMELDAVELLRRFLQHVLPPRFTRVRYITASSPTATGRATWPRPES
ncbi:MAG: transposase, partial [Acidobacteriota bacterium]